MGARVADDASGGGRIGVDVACTSGGCADEAASAVVVETLK